METVSLEDQPVGLDEAIELSFPKDTVFKTYDCTVRLGGEINHTVRKINVTARTIQLIRAIHGKGGVVDIVEVGTKKMNAMVHYFELALEYSKTLSPAAGVRLVEKTFGVRLLAFEPWFNDRNKKIDERRESISKEKNREAALYAVNRDKADAITKAELLTKKSAIESAKNDPVVLEEAPEVAPEDKLPESADPSGDSEQVAL